MEIHMTNIEQSLTKYDVTRQLAIIFHGPGYHQIFQRTPINFEVFLYGNSPGRGALTLPSDNIAEWFLSEYGNSYNGPPLKECWIGGNRVNFRKSQYGPRVDVVERITRFSYQDPTNAEGEERRRGILDSSSITIRKIQFGSLTRDNETTAIEWEYSHPNYYGRLMLKAEAPPAITVEVPRDHLDTAVIRIRLTNIRYISVGVSEPVIYLHLWHFPSFEIPQGNQTGYKRVSCLPLPGHKDFAPYVSEVLRFVCSSPDDLNSFRELYHIVHQSQTIDKEDVPITRTHIVTKPRIEQINAFIAQQEWCIAFQIELLVRRLLVDLREMVALIPEIRSLIKLKGPAYTAEVLIDYRSRLQDWNDEKEHHDDVVQCFIQATKSYARSVAEGKPINDPNVFQSYHVTITPARCLPDGPFNERSNRVIRWFNSSYHEHFLKVSFLDEPEVKMRYDRCIDGETYFRERIGACLKNGIVIAGREFQFLAYTQSSLKEHTVWFLRPFRDESGDINSDAIIKRIGLFESESELRRCPALFGARISQAFTATEASLVEVEETLFIRDKMTPDETYNYTDGVGTMSREFAEQVWSELKGTRRRTRNRTDPAISAFQIRFGGSKGMLSIDYKLKGNTICVRPSMRKFMAELTNKIEIAQFFDRPLKLTLNRPLVMLLENLGIPYKTFKELQDKAIQQTVQAMRNLNTAARMLENFGLGSSFRLVSILLELSRLGVDNLVQSESFHQSMLQFAVYHILRELKHHTRIPVENAWNLVGVADIHEHLREGEIFACVKPVNGQVQYLEGDVLITRSPVIHPGDVQIARAIGKPPPGSCFVHEPLINTVVFPTRGSRPMPSMLGGGDLDGDTYNVIPLNIHPGLRPRLTLTPASYSRPTRKLLTRDCKLEDVADFIVEYFHSDIVGLIATRWLIIADQNENGIFHEDCIKLADFHSAAVDYPKTGQPVNPQDLPSIHFRARPDWSAPENVKSDSTSYYKSKRAIGKLARAIRLDDMEPNSAAPRPERHKLRPGYPGRLSTAVWNLDTFVQEDDLYLLLQGRLGQFGINLHGVEEETSENILETYQNYLKIFEHAVTSFSMSTMTVLSEEEVILGTIAARASRIKDRREQIAKLRVLTQQLVKNTRTYIAGDDEDDLGNICRRAWSAWKISRKQVKQGVFGARSFQYVVLGLLLSSIRELEEAEEGDIRSLKRKRNTDSGLDRKHPKFTTTQRP